jgi:hypothetical protein
MENSSSARIQDDYIKTQHSYRFQMMFGESLILQRVAPFHRSSYLQH